MTFRNPLLLVSGMLFFNGAGNSWAQSIPVAPAIPTCSWDDTGKRSTCKFKDAMEGTPTSVVGNRVVLYNGSPNSGHERSRTYLQESLDRLAARYGFTVTTSEDPAIFTAANLADAKVVLMSNGGGDVVPAGAHRTALEDYQKVSGWGLIWVHGACEFITSGWPFGQQSCVQQYYFHNPSGTKRRMFIDSGTVANPNQGRKNPQSEFLLRNLPGWEGNRSPEMADEWHCFQAPARNTEGVNVLFGYDRSSGLPNNNCPQGSDSSESASRNHNMVWTHAMGKGITIRNSWGHEQGMYTANGNMGDSLLWRYIRYAAKDWCVGGSGEPGCDASTALRAGEPIPELSALQRNGVLFLSLPASGRFAISLADMGGRRVFSKNVSGPGKLEIPGLRPGLYLIRIGGERLSRTQRIMVH